MNFNDSRKLILIPWLSLPVVLASYSLFWDRIPTGLTVHFSPTGDPVTLMSRAASLLFSMAALPLVLLFYSWRVGRGGKNPARARVRYYFTVSAMTLIFLALLLSNV